MALVVGCLPLWLIWKVLNGHSVVRIMIMFVVSLFIISFSMTYCRMYKVRCAWWDYFLSVLQIYSVINQTQATFEHFFGCKFWLKSLSHYQTTFQVLVIMDMHLIGTDNLDIKYPLLVYQVTNVHFYSIISYTQWSTCKRFCGN